VLYGLWIVSYGNLADPITNLVSINSAWFLSQIGFDVSTTMSEFYPAVSLQYGGNIVINVIEGCNAINISILFIAFIFAYKNSMKRTLMFSLIGIIAIYIFNIVRVSGLFLIAKHFPDNLMFTHRFLFTGVIYAFVFCLWYLWVKKIAR
jgi:exosortase family protein XrtF